ncbi:MAG: Ig-like domain-containing protein, partial [Elusimicrobia bacterium]
AHGETLYDGTPPVLSALRVIDVTAKQALVAFASDKPATARVEWGLTAALGNAIPLAEATAFTVELRGLPSAALIYYKVTLTSRVGIQSSSEPRTFFTPLDLAVSASIDNVIYPNEPIVIRLDNPAVGAASYTSGAFNLFPPAVQGQTTLNVIIDDVTYSRTFFVDDPNRRYRMPRKAVGPGGEASASPAVKLLTALGQTAATGAAPLASERSRLFLGYLAGIDPMAPGPIADLAAVPGPGRGQVSMSWTAVGDDANVGKAMVYELRRSASPILTEADFMAATVTPLPVFPAPAGTSQSAVLSGLPDGAQLHFALKAIDEARNASPLGRAAAAATLAFTVSAETVAGAAAFELLSSVAGITVRRVESPGTLPVLRAAAQGFTLGGPLFEVTSPINPLPAPGALTLRYDPAAVGAAEALLKIYRFDSGAGSWELLADSRVEP